MRRFIHNIRCLKQLFLLITQFHLNSVRDLFTITINLHLKFWRNKGIIWEHYSLKLHLLWFYKYFLVHHELLIYLSRGKYLVVSLLLHLISSKTFIHEWFLKIYFLLFNHLFLSCCFWNNDLIKHLLHV